MRYLPFLSLFFLLNIQNNQAQILGCTDRLANNYNPSATQNNGTCTYADTSLSLATIGTMSANLIETSGLVAWNGRLWSHNDDTDTNIYSIDTLNAAVLQTHPLPRVRNVDWEEITQDADYFYVGDFGNNSNGNRTNLRIFKISKTETANGNVQTVDTILFSYADQTNFTATGGNNTDFDCEAFISLGDSLYLFTKQWVSQQTRVYALPKTRGTHIAQARASHNVGGLITGANLVQIGSRQALVLCGYSSTVQPFLWIYYDFAGTNFFSQNKRKLGISASFTQIEAVCSVNGLKYYLSNEQLVRTFLNVPARLYSLDLSGFLGGFLYPSAVGVQPLEKKTELSANPNPFGEQILLNLSVEWVGKKYQLWDTSGRICSEGRLENSQMAISTAHLPSGTYFLKVETQVIKLVKF
jgi:hypothetical protein